MRKVVIYRDAFRATYDFEPPLHAFKRREAVAQAFEIEAEIHTDRDGNERIAHVVIAEQRHRELSQVLALAEEPERCPLADTDVSAFPLSVLRKAKRLHAAAG